MTEQDDIRAAMHYEFDQAIDDLVASSKTSDQPSITIEIAPHLVERLRAEQAA